MPQVVKNPKLKTYMRKSYVSSHPSDPTLLQALLAQMKSRKVANDETPKRRRRRVKR